MIRNIALTVTIICAAAAMTAAPQSAVMAQGEKAVPLEQSERDFGQSFVPLAEQFGLSDHYYATKTERGSVLYSYKAPKTAETENDAKHATVTVFTIKQPAPFLEKYINSVQSAGVARRNLSDMKLYGQGNTMLAYTRYNIGNSSVLEKSGPQKKYYLSMVWQELPGVVANFQIEKSNEPFAQETIGLFEEIVKTTAESQKQKFSSPKGKQG